MLSFPRAAARARTRLPSTTARRVGPGAVAALVLAASSALAASALSTSGTVYNGCIRHTDGVIYNVTTASTTCKRKDTAISWNQTGPAGQTGAPGVAGPPGPAGAQGPQGVPGPANVITTGLHQAFPGDPPVTIAEADGITLELVCDFQSVTVQVRPTVADGVGYVSLYADSSIGGHVASTVNRGASPVVIESFGTSGDRASFNASVLGHTMDGTVSVTFAPTAACGYEASVAVG